MDFTSIQTTISEFLLSITTTNLTAGIFIPSRRQLLHLLLSFPSFSSNDDGGVPLLPPAKNQQHLFTPSTSVVSLTCPPLHHGPISCPIGDAPTEIDTCCLNHPSGHFLLAQFWDTSPVLGPRDSWTLHGLWPDLCTGGYDAYCDATRDVSKEAIREIVSSWESSSGNTRDGGGLQTYMDTYWKGLHGDADLWAHEWNKHGTCVSTLEPRCYLYEGGGNGDMDSSFSPPSKPHQHEQTNYNDILDYFTAATGLHATLDTHSVLAAHGISPSLSQTYTLEAIQAALSSVYYPYLSSAVGDHNHNNIATIKCNARHELNEIWLHYRVSGPIRNVTKDSAPDLFVPTAPDGLITNCPASGIRYLPKKESDHISPPKPPSPPPKYPPPSPPPSNDKPFQGKGHLKVRILTDDLPISGSSSSSSSFSSLSSSTGCLIRQGAWYTSGTCATYHSKTDVYNVAFTVDDVEENLEVLEDEYLFTLFSSYAPCAVLEADSNKLGRKGQFVCAKNLPVQSIFGVGIVTETETKAVEAAVVGKGSRNDVDEKIKDEGDKDKVLSWKGQTVFYADRIPHRFEKINVFADDGNNTRPVRLAIYWESV